METVSHSDRLDTAKHRDTTVYDHVASDHGAPPTQGTVHSLFASRARREAGRIAVECNDAVWSYADIADTMESIASYLVSQGVGRGHRVALLLPRAAETIAAMLGVMRAGAAFVPLDPGYPTAQLASIVEDCTPACVLADAALLAAAFGSVPPWAAPTHHLPDILAGATCRLPQTNDDAGADEPAYVMYTSGSTGRPKGVVIPHRAVLRLVIGADYAQLGPDEVVLQLAPLAFDACTFEIWGALLNGARLVVVPASRPTLDEIAAVIARHNVTTIWLTAGLFHVMVDHRIEAMRPLRQVLAGGDVLSPTHVAKLRRMLPGCRVINGYGPTENTTFTCCHSIADADLGGGSLPIGRPIAGTSVYILDEALLPVNEGDVGQLCTGGLGVALGYLNRPELTAERFVDDPFSATPGALMYLTGDLARRREDGAILFLGRMDRQVKVNGRRVELEEIERALRGQPGVQDAVAVIREDTPGRKRIVAYVTGAADGLATRLRANLPDWSIPAAIVSLPELPLTPNGKVDRARLPVPKAAPNLAPRTDMERQLATIFQRVLGVSAVGRDDNFFDLGATSLQLIEAHAEISCSLRPDVSLLLLFEAPRISELAVRIIDQRGAPEPSVADRARRAAAAMRQARTMHAS